MWANDFVSNGYISNIEEAAHPLPDKCEFGNLITHSIGIWRALAALLGVALAETAAEFVNLFLPHCRTAPRSCSTPGMSTWQAPPAIWQKNGGKSCRVNHPGARGKLSPARSPGQSLVFHLSSSRVR